MHWSLLYCLCILLLIYIGRAWVLEVCVCLVICVSRWTGHSLTLHLQLNQQVSPTAINKFCFLGSQKLSGLFLCVYPCWGLHVCTHSCWGRANSCNLCDWEPAFGATCHWLILGNTIGANASVACTYQALHKSWQLADILTESLRCSWKCNRNSGHTVFCWLFPWNLEQIIVHLQLGADDDDFSGE